MKTNHSGLAAAALCLLITPVTDAIGESSLPEQIDAIVQAEAGYDLFSGTVLVAHQGEIIYTKGVGDANKEYHIPNSLETRYNIGSIEKCFIATLVMKLVQEERLALTDPLSKYYPECPIPTAGEIQLTHLLNHSSGLGDYRDNPEYQLRAAEFQTIGDALPYVCAQEPAFAPGERYRYSNSGVLLVKGILEQVTGRRLRQLLPERIFRPLGMQETVLFVGGDVLENRASGYRRAGDGETIVRVLGEPAGYTGGGIYSTAHDLLLFEQSFYGNQLLDEESKNIMFTPVGPDPTVAYGWFVVPFGGTNVISHSGGSGGFASELRRYPEKGYTLIVMSNYAAAGFELTNAIEALLLGLPYEIATEVTVRYRKAMALQGSGNYQGAADLFAKNTQGSNPHLPSLYQAARTRIMGEFEQDQAIALLDRYIEQADETSQPGIAAAQWRKGVAHEQLGDRAKALACYRESLETDPAFSLAEEALERLDNSN